MILLLDQASSPPGSTGWETRSHSHLPRTGGRAHNEKGCSLGRREAQTWREELGVFIGTQGQKRFAEDVTELVLSPLLHFS